MLPRKTTFSPKNRYTAETVIIILTNFFIFCKYFLAYALVNRGEVFTGGFLEQDEYALRLEDLDRHHQARA